MRSWTDRDGVVELESAADARERDREIAQLIQDNDADDDMDDL